MTDLPAGVMTRINTWIGDLPSTNAKTVAVIGLDYLTFLLVVVCALRSMPLINETVLDAWLAFLAALNGIAYKQFSKQRETDYRYVDLTNKGPADPTPPAALDQRGVPDAPALPSPAQP